MDLRGKSNAWLRRNRPSPYTILYEAIADRAPEVLCTYADLVIEKDYVVGEGRQYQPQFRPDDVNYAILLIKPNSASLMAKVIRRPGLVSQITAAQKMQKSLGNGDHVPTGDMASLLFNQTELSYMQKSDYTIGDLQVWVEILLEPNVSRAVARLNDFMFANSQWTEHRRPRIVPVVLLTTLANRSPLDPRSMQTLLTCLWLVLRLRPYESARGRQYMKIFHTFAKQATKVWPDCLPNLASLLIVFLPHCWNSWERQSRDTDVTHDTHHDRESLFSPSDFRRQFLMDSFNKAIVLLSLPAGPNPYRASMHLEKAQFMILSHMVNYNPPLQVNSDAFSALTSVQLRRARTPQETEWAVLQSRGWPPYPKPRTAMDEDKGYDFGSSRAVRTLMHMRQAGYALSDWEQIARIYAGWDTDMTPTIQTRVAFLSHHTGVLDIELECHAWAARIATTRDVREAWALYLQYENAQLPPFYAVYSQMFRKLREEDRRLERDLSRTEEGNIVPGTVKEVVSPSTSPMQRVFVSSEPPTFMELFQHVAQQPITAPPWFIAVLIGNSPSIEDAVSIWKQASHKLKDVSMVASTTEPAKSETRMPKSVFRGFIRLLSRFPADKTLLQHMDAATKTAIYDDCLNSFYSLTGSQVVYNDFANHFKDFAIWQAIYFVKTRQSDQPAVWHSLLKGIMSLLLLYKAPRRPPAYCFFGPVMSILEHMQRFQVAMEHDFFDHLCQFMERAGRSAIRYLHGSPLEMSSDNDAPEYRVAAAKMIIAQSPLVMRRIFAKLCSSTVDRIGLESSTAGTNAENWVPRAVSTPSAMFCQHYVRALATFGDFEGIYTFARWLANHESDMVASLEHENRASEKWTVALTTFRVALEFPQHMFYNFPIEILKKPTPELVSLIRTTLEGMTELGGWATDAQVEDYGLYVGMHAAMQRHHYTMGVRTAKYEPYG